MLKAFWKNIRKSWVLIVLCGAIISGAVGTLFQHYQTRRHDFVYLVESKILDWKQVKRGQDTAPTKVGILAIDEASLAEFGRWPFSRKYYSQALDNLKELGVKWVGFDAIWAEPEKTRLEDVEHHLKGVTRKNYRKRIKALSQMVNVSPSDQNFVDGIRRFENVVMGYFYFASKLEAEDNLGDREPFAGLDDMLISSLEADLPDDTTLADYHYMSKAHGMVANAPHFAQASEYFAFFSNNADDDAINRWVTLVANVDGNLMPSLSLKTAAEFLNSEIFVLFDEFGIETILLVNREDEEKVVEIPVDPVGGGRILVKHRGPARGFQHFSLADAYNKTFTDDEKAKLKGSVLLLGATATGINDMRPNPFDPAIDGVENHAAVVDNIIKQEFLHRPASIYTIEILIVLIVGLLFAPLMIWGKALVSGLAVIIFLFGYYYFDKIFWFDRGVWAYSALPTFEILGMFIVTNIVKYITEEKDKKFLKQAFGSYISPELIDEMYGSGEPPKLGGDLGILTAYFTDIQSFSSFSEKLSAEKLVELLNEYLTAMTDILLAEKGTLDKYEGDAIIAFFGAPMTLPDHAKRACLVAIRMQESLLTLRKKWVSEGDKWPDIVKNMRMRIGLNSGEIVTGNMGSRDRMNYTMMGDSVNLAARLEEAAKQYGIYNHISHFTKDLTGDYFEMRELDTIRVVGKKEPVTTFDLLGVKGSTGSGLIKLKDSFHAALALYKKMQWDEAIAAFQAVVPLEEKRYENNKTNPSLVYIDRCEQFKANPPPQDWDGVFTLTSK